MRVISFFGAAVVSVMMLITSCDSTTNEIGTSLTDKVDHLEITSNTYYATSRSVEVPSVVSRSATGYLGRIIDPETGARITGDFMTQFNCPEKYTLQKIDSIASRDADGQVYADSCEVRLFYTKFYGDSLSTMKVTLYELERPMLENTNYYSDFDPLEQGFVRADGIKKNQTYTLVNTNEKKSKKKSDNYVDNICVRLNEPYTDRNGKVYNNFGTFVLQNYYNHHEYFKNSYEFAKHILPGFFFKVTGGLGSMAYISIPQLNIYYRKYINKLDSTAMGLTLFNGTEEILQTTTITNDHVAISTLVEDESCTYIKSPSGIFTEVTLPVDEIIKGHENDTINTAKITFNRINNENWSKYSLPASSTLLMLECDSLTTFFEKGNIPNSKRSFLTTYNSSTNSYVFSNIEALIRAMYKAKTNGLKSDPQWVAKHPNWNKVTLVPVSTSTTTSSNTTIVTGVTNDMSLTSTRLAGGRTPIAINVIYSKFK